MINIPFDANDNFDCLVTRDVLEHVQLKDINRAFREMKRLNCKWMAHLINHTDIKPDHFLGADIKRVGNCVKLFIISVVLFLKRETYV